MNLLIDNFWQYIRFLKTYNTLLLYFMLIVMISLNLIWKT